MRGKFVAIILMSACLAFTQGVTCARYPLVPVTVSKEKVRMDGRVYYSHIVLEKQTLYSISKAYGVSIQDIYDANPSLKEEGLKKNAIILVPVLTSDNAKEVSSALPAADADAVDKKPESDVNAAQEVKKEKPKDQKRKSREKKTRSKDVFVTHTVKWYENLEMISEKYGVPVELIMEINGLSGKKLSNRQKLKIPADLTAYLAAHAAEKQESEKADAALAAVQDSESKPAETAVQDRKGSVNAVLMMPFQASEGKGSVTCMDFYSGALLAARELGLEGINVDLDVYDTMGDTPPTAEISARNDFIIGPVSAEDLEKVLAAAPATVEVISPIDPRTGSLTASHSNFIQVPEPAKEQFSDLIRWIGEDKDSSDRIVAIYEKGARAGAENEMVSALIRESGMIASSFSYNILEGRDVLESMETLMDSTAVNRVLVVSESEAFVNDVVRNLNLMIHDRYSIVLYGPSRLRGFETIDVEDYHNVNLHVSSPYYIDYDTPEVQSFLLKYRALFNTEPGAFAFQGYDVMHYFISQCSRYGSGWADRLADGERVRMLQTDFRFTREADGGLKNTAIRRIIYGPRYTVTLLD